MFVFDHRPDFEKKFIIPASKIEKYEVIFFYFTVTYLRKLFHKNSNGSFPLLSSEQDKLTTAKRDISKITIATNLVSSYLLIFYDYLELTEQWKYKFENFSYTEYSSHDLKDIKLRIEEVVNNNFNVLIDNVNLNIRNQSYPESFKGKKFGDFAYRIHETFDTIDKYFDKDTSPFMWINNALENEIDIDIVNGLYKLITDAKYQNLSLSIYDIDKINRPVINDELIDTIKLKYSISISAVVINFSIAHMIFRNLAHAIMAWDLLDEMERKFQISNHYLGKYYSPKPKTLIEDYSHIERAHFKNISLPDLANIMFAKGRRGNPNNSYRFKLGSIRNAVNKHYK